MCAKMQVCRIRCMQTESDIPGGSTLRNLSNEKVSLNTADIGLAQLAMHSSYETAGSRDTEYMVKMIKEFYKTEIVL